MRSTIAITMLGAALAAAPALAQSTSAPPPPPPTPVAPPAPPAPTPPRLRMIPGRPLLRAFDDSTYRNRATLGMSLSSTGSRRDTLGVFVTRVVPGGPAERAGIVEGDRIASIDDISLRLSNIDLDDPYAAGLPAHRISRAVGKLTPGNSVRLRVYSNGRFRDVSVTTGKMSDVYKGRDRMMFSLDGLNGLDALGPAMAGIGSALDGIGPAIAEGIGPELERIGPRIRVEVQRAMDAIPRDVHIELDRQRAEP